MRKTISLYNSDCTFTARKRNALCAKTHLFVKKAQIGFGKVKGHLGCFNPKEKQFSYWETFRDSWGVGKFSTIN
jgi:hypothetical protein